MKRRYSFSILLAIALFLTAFVTFKTPVKVFGRAEQSKAECVIEANSRRVLYEERGDLRLPMASTTKIATAITVIENEKNLDRTVKIPAQAAGIEGSSVYLKAGEEYSLKDLLYGLMLRSGNDCAVALAIAVSGCEEAFASRMNDTAQKAGAINSRFRNPHGLPKENHYTTARDLSFITAYALENAVFKEIVATKYYQPRNWTNKNKMLTNYEGAIGVKTGYTKQAGRCLVTAAERDGLTLVCTVLNCPTMYERTKQLLDDAFAAYTNYMLIGASEQVSIEINGKRVNATTGKDIYYPLMEEEKPLLERVIKPKRSKENDKIVGEIEIYLLKR
ncbi:MAG: D-alanyl-D-alanine carboxypeptidase, partial [Clostridia bacterium]|nr:D-alanyl-D-alanine carboxypeptidase [Clostridia bacterium]